MSKQCNVHIPVMYPKSIGAGEPSTGTVFMFGAVVTREASVMEVRMQRKRVEKREGQSERERERKERRERIHVRTGRTRGCDLFAQMRDLNSFA